MKLIDANTYVIFGGTGFIGIHFTRYLLELGKTKDIFLVDIKPPTLDEFPDLIKHAIRNGNVQFVKSDVRKPINASELPTQADIIINLAAIHREPGHEPREYFETNILGAENVCNWAEKVKCNTIVFTSSISPYGPSEKPKTEKSLPEPLTPYGSSKLIAEKIHQLWQKGDSARKLLIVRPGVVFGPGEGGNVTRLVKAVLGRYFIYMGNKNKIKAGGYVKELCHSIDWMLSFMEEKKRNFLLYNFSLNPPPTVEDYVSTICEVAGVKRRFPSLPYPLLNFAAFLMSAFLKPFNISHPFSPVRIKKLVRSNNIIPEFLIQNGYQFHYTLKEAQEDWKKEKPSDWGLRN